MQFSAQKEFRDSENNYWLKIAFLGSKVPWSGQSSQLQKVHHNYYLKNYFYFSNLRNLTVNFQILAKCHEFENVIERQRAEIDDLRTRLMERKKWEDIWKESLKTFFGTVQRRLRKQSVCFRKKKNKFFIFEYSIFILHIWKKFIWYTRNMIIIKQNSKMIVKIYYNVFHPIYWQNPINWHLFYIKFCLLI